MDLKELAKEFCEIRGVDPEDISRVDWNKTNCELFASVISYAIDKGVVVVIDEYNLVKAHNKELRNQYSRIAESTVSSAGKTLDECKDIIAVKNGFKDWFDYVFQHQIGRLVMNAVCELYAQQFKSSPASTEIPEISDEEIEERAHRYSHFVEGGQISVDAYIDGIQWYREQLKRNNG